MLAPRRAGRDCKKVNGNGMDLAAVPITVAVSSDREQCASLQREWIGIVSWVACSDRTAIPRALIVQSCRLLAA